MFKIIILAILCAAIVNGNLQNDIKDKASEALNQGEKLKVCDQKICICIFIFGFSSHRIK